jgi:rfaE bifunctional protein nucleotidyltransferase chain/domain
MKNTYEKPKIVFTNGCFDLIHPGHISVLMHCKLAYGDNTTVIVGLNSDESIKRIKGNNRPVTDQVTRKIILEAIRYVDAVMIFDEDTPLELINKIKPDIIVKGGGYNEDDVVGAELIKTYGGKVVTIPYVGSWSTTETINSIILNNDIIMVPFDDEVDYANVFEEEIEDEEE